MTATHQDYLAGIVDTLKLHWPQNRTVNIVCHGHSVPAGYFATPVVNTAESYPRLLHDGLKARFPFAVINVIITAVGGENAVGGAMRFESDVLPHRPDVLTLDYALNDRGLGLERAEANWRQMIEAALAREIKVLLLTPTLDTREPIRSTGESPKLALHAEMIRGLAEEYSIGLADSHRAFIDYMDGGGDLSDLMSWINHPNGAGHRLVAKELLRWFPPR